MLAGLALGLALGLASAVHCVAMCGPLVAFAALGPGGATDPWRVARYQLGRAIGYGAVGAVAGGIGATLASVVPAWSGAVLSVALGIGLVVTAYRLWPRSPETAAATETEIGLVALGTGPSRPSIRDRAARLAAAVVARSTGSPLALGLASALLPCGVLAAGALVAAGTGTLASGAAAMLGLALASGLATSIAGAALGRVRLAESPALARAMAVTFAIGALVLFVRPTLVSPDGAPACHAEP